MRRFAKALCAIAGSGMLLTGGCESPLVVDGRVSENLAPSGATAREKLEFLAGKEAQAESLLPIDLTTPPGIDPGVLSEHEEPGELVAVAFDDAIRQVIETVNSQLSEQFYIEINHAHTFWGLCTRLISKLTAHTLCIYLNRLLGKPEFLQIKALAFPN